MELVKIKKDTQFKTITKFSWDLMGDDKNGWSLEEDGVSSVSVTNEAIPPVAAPQTGNAKPIENEAIPPVAAPQSFNDSKATLEFIEVAKDTKPNILKDFLDKNNIKFSNNSTHNKLIDIVAGYFNNNVEQFKKEF